MPILNRSKRKLSSELERPYNIKERIKENLYKKNITQRFKTI